MVESACIEDSTGGALRPLASLRARIADSYSIWRLSLFDKLYD